MNADPSIPKEVDDALTLELAATPKQFVYTIAEVTTAADVTILKVDLDDSKDHGLDESLEGAAAWWPGPPKGVADVLSVDPERETINLRYVSPKPPAVGETVFLYPPQFLEALRDWWRIPTNSHAASVWLQSVDGQNEFDPSFSVPPLFNWLRTAQKNAFKLPGWRCGFLEGPPGTGKTTTLGVVLASVLQKNPNWRILLLSTTNTAVDLALVKVDEALEKLPGSFWNLRMACKRLGHHYHAGHYKGREHLLPSADPALVQELAKVESLRPDPQDVVAYSAWKREVERIRAKLKSKVTEVLRRSRLAAMTSCAAMFWTAALHEVAPFDLVVFDEASQVGLAYAMALGTFGKRVIFAGDPAQLAPIVQSKHPPPQKWLGRSPFDGISATSSPNGPSIFLDEQSRMCEDICKVVSDLFYRGRLRVAINESGNLLWQTHRRLTHRSKDLSCPISVISVPASGAWSAKYRGPIRFQSAKAVESLIADLLKSEAANSILVLSPFRAQRTLLRTLLRSLSKDIAVSTVHKAQGSERRTVIFDTVNGTSNFLLGDQARRLLNVALSRAEARLVLMLSEDDKNNPFLKHPLLGSPMVPIGQRPPPAKAEPMESFVNRPDFPRCLKGKCVKHRDVIGLVTDVSGGRITIEQASGATVAYNADFLKATLGDKQKSSPTAQRPHPTRSEWPVKECRGCGSNIRLVKVDGRWMPYEVLEFKPHRCCM